MSLQDSIEARSLILLFLGLLLGPLCYLTPVSTNQFQCTAGPNSNPLNLVEALSSWQRHPEGAAASPTEQGSHEPWENGHHQGTDGQSKETAFPHPSSLRTDNGKAEPKPGGPHDAELCQTPSTARGNRAHHSGSFFQASLEKQAHVLCLSWLYQSGASSERASELGNANNGEWDSQSAHGHPLRGLISGKW